MEPNIKQTIKELKAAEKKAINKRQKRDLKIAREVISCADRIAKLFKENKK